MRVTVVEVGVKCDLRSQRVGKATLTAGRRFKTILPAGSPPSQKPRLSRSRAKMLTTLTLDRGRWYVNDSGTMTGTRRPLLSRLDDSRQVGIWARSWSLVRSVVKPKSRTGAPLVLNEEPT